ncbi:MAG: hypothetical protein Q9227_004701 [Pyrenula ochraceoflavens]
MSASTKSTNSIKRSRLGIQPVIPRAMESPKQTAEIVKDDSSHGIEKDTKSPKSSTSEGATPAAVEADIKNQKVDDSVQATAIAASTDEVAENDTDIHEVCSSRSAKAVVVREEILPKSNESRLQECNIQLKTTLDDKDSIVPKHITLNPQADTFNPSPIKMPPVPQAPHDSSTIRFPEPDKEDVSRVGDQRGIVSTNESNSGRGSDPLIVHSDQNRRPASDIQPRPNGIQNTHEHSNVRSAETNGNIRTAPQAYESSISVDPFRVANHHPTQHQSVMKTHPSQINPNHILLLLVEDPPPPHESRNDTLSHIAEEYPLFFSGDFSPHLSFNAWLHGLETLSESAMNDMPGIWSVRRPDASRFGGFRLSEGGWFCRFLHQYAETVDAAIDWNGLTENESRNSWIYVNNEYSYQHIVSQIVGDTTYRGATLCVKHAMQRTRDDRFIWQIRGTAIPHSQGNAPLPINGHISTIGYSSQRAWNSRSLTGNFQSNSFGGPSEPLNDSLLMASLSHAQRLALGYSVPIPEQQQSLSTRPHGGNSSDRPFRQKKQLHSIADKKFASDTTTDPLPAQTGSFIHRMPGDGTFVSRGRGYTPRRGGKVGNKRRDSSGNPHGEGLDPALEGNNSGKTPHRGSFRGRGHNSFNSGRPPPIKISTDTNTSYFDPPPEHQSTHRKPGMSPYPYNTPSPNVYASATSFPLPPVMTPATYYPPGMPQAGTSPVPSPQLPLYQQQPQQQHLPRVREHKTVAADTTDPEILAEFSGNRKLPSSKDPDKWENMKKREQTRRENEARVREYQQDQKQNAAGIGEPGPEETSQIPIPIERQPRLSPLLAGGKWKTLNVGCEKEKGGVKETASRRASVSPKRGSFKENMEEVGREEDQTMREG